MIKGKKINYTGMGKESLIKLIKTLPKKYQYKMERILKEAPKYEDRTCHVCNSPCRVNTKITSKYKSLEVCPTCWEKALHFYKSIENRLKNKRHKECFLICSAEELLLTVLRFRFKCAYTNQPIEPTTDYEIEHLIPIKDENKTNGTCYNMLLIKQGVNRSKRDKTFVEWYTSDNPYLEGGYSEKRKSFIIENFYKKSEEFNNIYWRSEEEARKEYDILKEKATNLIKHYIWGYYRESEYEELLISELESICYSYECDEREKEANNHKREFKEGIKEFATHKELSIIDKYLNKWGFMDGWGVASQLDECIKYMGNIENELNSIVDPREKYQRSIAIKNSYVKEDALKILKRIAVDKGTKDIESYIKNYKVIIALKNIFDNTTGKAKTKNIPIDCTFQQFEKTIKAFGFKCAYSNQPLTAENIGIAFLIPLGLNGEKNFVASNLIPIDKNILTYIGDKGFIEVYNEALPFYSPKRREYIEENFYKGVLREVEANKRKVEEEEKERKREKTIKLIESINEIRSPKGENELNIFKKRIPTLNTSFKDVTLDDMTLVKVDYDSIFDTPFTRGAGIDITADGVSLIGVDGTKTEIVPR